MWTFFKAFGALLAFKYLVFWMETKYHFVANFIANSQGIIAQKVPSVLGLPVTAMSVAFAASIVVAVVCSIRWPMLMPALIVMSVVELLAFFPQINQHFDNPQTAFWSLNGAISIVVSAFLLDRREMWHVYSFWRVVSKLVLPVAFVAINFALSLIYANVAFNDKRFWISGLLIVASCTTVFFTSLLGLEDLAFSIRNARRLPKIEDDLKKANEEVVRLQGLVSKPTLVPETPAPPAAPTTPTHLKAVTIERARAS